jgi:hypothetical protein
MGKKAKKKSLNKSHATQGHGMLFEGAGAVDAAAAR